MSYLSSMVHKAIQEVITNIDFDRIQSVMKYIDWKSDASVYSVAELKDLAYQLLKDAANAAEEYKEPVYITSEGFKATAVYDQGRVVSVELEYRIDWDAQSVNILPE